jgi:MFS family permease
VSRPTWATVVAGLPLRREGGAVTPRRILLAAVVAQSAISFAEQGVPTIVVFVKHDLALSATAAGAIVAALGLGRIIGFYAAGRAVDTRGERRVLFAGAVGSGACVAIAAAFHYGGMLVVLTVAGLFLATATPAGGKLVFGSFPDHRRGLAMGIRQAGVPIGGLAAAIMLPFVAQSFGWRPGFVLAGIVSIAGGFAAVALAGRGPRVTAAERRRSPRGSIRPFLHREFLLITMWACVLVGCQYALLTFFAVDAHGRADISLARAASLIIVLQIGGIVGRLGWGQLADRFPRLRARWLFALLSLVGAACTATLALTSTGNLVFLAVIGLIAGLSINGWQGIWISRLTELAGIERAGTATGFSLTFLGVALTLSTPVYGAIADASGSLRASWIGATAMLVLAGLAVTFVPQSRAGLGRASAAVAEA